MRDMARHFMSELKFFTRGEIGDPGAKHEVVIGKKSSCLSSLSTSKLQCFRKVKLLAELARHRADFLLQSESVLHPISHMNMSHVIPKQRGQYVEAFVL